MASVLVGDGFAFFLVGAASFAIGAAVAGLGIDAAENLGVGNNVVVGAIIGGTASHLSGGKFANGALSGAFIAIYNHNAHSNNEAQQSSFDWADAAWLAFDVATFV